MRTAVEQLRQDMSFRARLAKIGTGTLSVPQPMSMTKFLQ